MLPRSLIFVLCYTNIATYMALHGMMKNDCVPLLVDPSLNTGYLSKLINQYLPQYIWTTSEHTFDNAYSIHYRIDHFVLLKTNYTSISIHEDLALLLMTSGTTGSPNLIRLSYNNIDACCKTLKHLFNLTNSDYGITVLPIHHGYGFIYMYLHWKVKAPIIVTQRNILSKEFWDLFSYYNVTSFAGVSYTYEILDKINFFEQTYPALRLMIISGGIVKQHMIEKIQYFSIRNHILSYNMYGQTEALFATYIPPHNILHKYDTIGIPLDGVSVSVDDNEFICQSSSVSMGNANCLSDLFQGDINNGIVHTGDEVTLDSDGYIKIIGRKKRFTKITGVRISLDQIEKNLNEKYTITNFACTGSENKLYIFYTSDLDIQNVQNFLLNNSNIHHSFVQFHRIYGSLPLTASGKINYQILV